MSCTHAIASGFGIIYAPRENFEMIDAINYLMHLDVYFDQILSLKTSII